MIRCALILFIILFQIHEKSEASDCKPLVAVYPTWKHDEHVMEKLPWDRFTHLAIFAVHPNESAQLVSSDADVFIKEISLMAHSKGKKIVISIGGAGEASKAFLKVANDRGLRNTFAKNVARYVQDNHIDGVDIDWEYWSYQNEKGKGGNDPVESKNLVHLVSELRKVLPKNIMLTADIIAGPWLGDQYLPEIQDHVDYVNLMAFDFTGEWGESSIGHHSDFRTFKKAIAYAIGKGFRKEKLLIGLPAYGKEFINGKNKTVRNVSYTDIVQTLKGDESLLKKGRFQNIYFETRQNIQKKVKYLNKNGFPGVTLFEVTSDHNDDKFSLLESASAALNPNSCYNKAIHPTNG